MLQPRGNTRPDTPDFAHLDLAEELIKSDLPDDPFLHTDLFVYFPTKMQHAYRQQMLTHPLKREIIVTGSRKP